MSQQSPPSPERSRKFETEIDIDAPVDAVWRAISDDKELRRWFAPDAKIEAKAGGEVVWRWSEHHTWIQRVEICEPGRRLRTRYDSQVDDGEGGKRPLFIDFVLEGKGGMTTLRLSQSGFGMESGFDEEYDGISRGWPVELRSLRLYLEKHRGSERQMAWTTFEASGSTEQIWKRLTGPEGFSCGVGIQGLMEGEGFRLRTRVGDLEGTALTCHPHEFTGVVENLGDAFLRICVYRWGGRNSVWLWLGCYDQPEDRVQELRRHFEDIAQSFANQGTTQQA